MKKLFVIGIALAFCLSSVNSMAQDAGRKLPSVKIKTLTGEIASTDDFSNDGKPMIIDFWATWCKPCIEELNAIHEVYSEWQEETGVKLIAVSIDDSRTMTRVAPFVNGKGWDYENYVDPNGDLKRALNVNMPPHTFVLNGKGEIVWQHVGFTEGSQEELIQAVRDILKEKTTEPVKLD